MAYYAFLDENNIVTEVIPGKDENKILDGLTPEQWYGNFRGQKCLRTSYNGNIRGTFAGIGYSYNEDEDIFIAPKPYPSWVRNGSYWEAPVSKPMDEKKYKWDEETTSWIEVA